MVNYNRIILERHLHSDTDGEGEADAAPTGRKVMAALANTRRAPSSKAVVKRSEPTYLLIIGDLVKVFLPSGYLYDICASLFSMSTYARLQMIVITSAI